MATTVLPAGAMVVLPQNLEDLEAQSQLIFAGVCASHSLTVNEQGLPVHAFTFSTTRGVKGGMQKGALVTFRQLGGQVRTSDGLTTRFPGLPQYKIGAEALLFLSPPSRLGLTSPVGFEQGVFAVGPDGRGGRWIALDPLRRRLLAKGIDRARYAGSARFTADEKRILFDPPARVDLELFCSLVSKIGQERESRHRW
jgi:hypothetical protein